MLLQQELIMRTEVTSLLHPETIYIGGGTPSLLGYDGFIKLTELLKQTVNMDQLKEWSVEINPASANSDLLKTMHLCGINRLTFGIQSFKNEVLETINRAHNAQCAAESINMAREHGFANIGIDLIAGLPGIDREAWKEDLHTALSLNPQHLSIYALSVEKETELAKMVDKGLSVPDIDEQFERLSDAEEILTKSGFNRYEISNYALPGYECRHNQGIWRGEDYLGIGPAAASRVGLNRLENKPDFNAWMANLRNNVTPPHTCEALTLEDDAQQRVLFRLRLQEGFSPDESIECYPHLSSFRAEWDKTLNKMKENGALTEKNGKWCLTERGREICDYVIRELM